MMKKLILLLHVYGIFHSITCFSQPASKIDSLLSVLTTQNHDTVKVNILNELSRQCLIIKKVAEAKKYAGDALVLAERKAFKKGIASAYHFLGIAYIFEDNYPEAFKSYQAALEIFKEIGDVRGMGDAYNNIGIIYEHQGNYPAALKNYLASLKSRDDIIDKTERDRREIAFSYNNIGIIYGQQGNFPEALKYCLASLKMKEAMGDKRGIAASYLNIGIIYANQGNYTESLKNYFSSLKLCQETGDKYGIAICYSNIGTAYIHQGNYSESLSNHLSSLKIYEEIRDKSGIADCYGNLGVIYMHLDNLPDALKNYLAALKIYEETGEKRGIAESYINIGLVYIKLKENTLAKEYLSKSLTLSTEIGSKDNIKNAYEGLSKLDSAIGDFRQALIHFKLYSDYKDSIFNESNSNQITRMKEQYESEKKDKEIDKLENEKKISALLLKTKQDSLVMAESEKEKVKLENEKILAFNLYNQRQIESLGKEKQIQQLQIERDQADYSVQKAIADKKQEQLELLSKEKRIQSINLKKQKQANNYFLAGLILFALLSVFIYRNYRTRQQLKLQTLRNKIARDLHDDVGSTLSSISIFSQMAQQQSKEYIPALNTIGENSRVMLDTMADIVWAIDPENDQFEKIILRMKNFAFELLGAKNIDFEFIADDHVSKVNAPMNIRKNLYLIFKEATNNMVKYSGADRALYSVKSEKNNLTMLIKDNGKGFDITRGSNGNGLKNMKKRAFEMGGDLIIDTSPGKGTILSLCVKI